MIWRSAPIARGWSKRICHHQFVASRPPFHALPGSAENRSPLMAPSAVKPPKTLDAETTGAGGVTASAQARAPQAANRMNRTAIQAEVLFVMLFIWPRVIERSLPSERKFRAGFNEQRGLRNRCEGRSHRAHREHRGVRGAYRRSPRPRLNNAGNRIRKRCR